MQPRQQISDLSQTGHQQRTARLILASIGRHGFEKTYKDKEHKISVKFDKRQGLVYIDLHKKDILTSMTIHQKTAITQAHQLSQAHRLLQA